MLTWVVNIINLNIFIAKKKWNMDQIHITINVEEFSGAKVIEFKMQ